MRESMMMIKTRPATYPSNKLTFTIDDLAKNKEIRYLNINLDLNGHFNVDLILEDSQRNFLNSFLKIPMSNTIQVKDLLTKFSEFTECFQFYQENALSQQDQLQGQLDSYEMEWGIHDEGILHNIQVDMRNVRFCLESILLI